MLNTSSIFAALTLAEQFDANGVLLTPLAGSPLHHLAESTNATPDMAVKLASGEISIDFCRLELASSTKEGVFDRSRHDYAMDDFIKVSAQSVQNALNVSRTFVAPRIAELLDLVTMRLTNAPISDLTRIRISEEEDCPALYGPGFRKLVDTYANYPNTEPRLSVNGPDLSTGDILKMVETGVASIDDLLMPWAASLPERTLQYAYTAFFTLGKNSRDDRGFFARIEKSAANMVLVYCIARHLSENDTLLDGVAVDLKEYRGALTDIMAQAAHMLSIQMERNDSAIKNGNMVRSIAGNEIRVFPPVYRAWLESGGDTDVLYGMAVSGKQKFTVDSIMSEAPEFLKSWRSYSSLIGSRDSVARFTYLRDQLVMSYESILAKPNDEGQVGAPYDIKTEMDTFKSILKGMTINDTDDLHAMCLKLVCRTSFSKTPAELILTKMDEEAKRNPKLTPREAGALATLWYISSWVASLIVPANA